MPSWRIMGLSKYKVISTLIGNLLIVTVRTVTLCITLDTQSHEPLSLRIPQVPIDRALMSLRSTKGQFGAQEIESGQGFSVPEQYPFSPFWFGVSLLQLPTEYQEKGTRIIKGLLRNLGLGPGRLHGSLPAPGKVRKPRSLLQRFRVQGLGLLPPLGTVSG